MRKRSDYCRRQSLHGHLRTAAVGTANASRIRVLGGFARVAGHRRRRGALFGRGFRLVEPGVKDLPIQLDKLPLAREQLLPHSGLRP